MRQFASYGCNRTLSTEHNIALVQYLNGIEALDLPNLAPKLKTWAKMIKEMLPRTIFLSDRPLNHVEVKDDANLIAEKEPVEMKRQKILLGKGHWKLKSEISARTFFENNYGWQSNSVPSLTQLLGGFSNTISPQLIFARGFKTRHSDPEVRSSLFGKTNSDNIVGSAPELKLGSVKEKSPVWEEGYIAGVAAARGINSKSSSENETSPTKQKQGVGEKLWSVANKLYLVLGLTVCVVLISQFTGFRFGFTRGTNEVMPEDIEVTFDDVKGCDEAKQELQEIVEFLMNPEKFSALGGKLPKGCLLEGPPGTGKTLLARAIAGQAGVPFFQASGSEFDEVLVGQGARRVRDLFKTAKERAPCVIFIDEMDSVGGKRTSSVLHPYANQTINQLLAEMDGFVSNEGVIVIGATNRKDQLDKALLRPGRFDTQVSVQPPDMRGRKEILNLYLSKIKHDESVDVDKLSRMTVGFTGADLENMVNTSAIRAAVEGKDWVTMSEFEYSHDKQTLGTDWKSRIRDKDDLKITAYHEAGHTLVNYFTENTDPLHKVTIVSKGMSGGHTAFIPEKDSTHRTKAQLIAQLDVSMGGRIAEEIYLGKDKVTGGASSDLETATFVAELMVKKLGMSEKFGLRVVKDEQSLDEKEVMSEGTKDIMDAEVNRLLNESYKRATNILKAHRKELDLLSDALLKYETLDADDVKAIIEGDPRKLGQRNSLNSNSKIYYKGAELPNRF